MMKNAGGLGQLCHIPADYISTRYLPKKKKEERGNASEHENIY